MASFDVGIGDSSLKPNNSGWQNLKQWVNNNEAVLTGHGDEVVPVSIDGSVPANSGFNPDTAIDVDNNILDISGISQSQWDLDKTKELLEQQRAYNSAEAAKNREWQERMSNTAYQRAVQDLEAAGLNKWLAVTGGNGASASTPSGATASSSAGDASTPNPVLAKQLLQSLTSILNSAFGLVGKFIGL